MTEYTRADGAVVRLWNTQCGDCGFLTGLAEVSWPDGTRKLLSGAGCRQQPRRGPQEARAWAESVEHP